MHKTAITALLLLSTLLIISLIVPTSTLFAQETVTIEPPKQGSPAEENQRSHEREGDGIGWMVFLFVTASSLGMLFWVLHFCKKKQTTSATGEENGPEESPTLQGWQIVVAKLLYAAIAVELFILLITGSWLFFIGTIGITLFISISHWEAVQEIKKTFGQGGRVSSHLVKKEKTTFKDVGGLGEVIEELRDVVSLYKNPKEAELWGIRKPKGILLIGPPGCGKTLLARAVAGEAELPFFSYSAAEIGTSYIRSGAGEIKVLFRTAEATAPCLIFFDEIDALGRKRGYDSSGEFDHALNEFLHELDGIKKQEGILILAATNREDMLDEALLRPGRFDKKIVIPHPDLDAREKILHIHTRNKKLAADVNVRELAQKTVGFDGATLEQSCNEAAQVARKRFEDEQKKRSTIESVVSSVKEFFIEPLPEISMADFDEGLQRTRDGLARKSIMSAEERRTIAWHEMGHAMVTAELGLEMLDKVTLVPRNWALGMTISRGEETHLPSKALILARITSLLGGRAAEEVLLGPDRITTGAGNDFEKAAELSRRMVCEWGMSKFGPALFYKLGPAPPWHRPLSESTAAEIDKEVAEIISRCHHSARDIIVAKKDIIAQLVELLLEKTSLNAKEITEFLAQHSKSRE